MCDLVLKEHLISKLMSLDPNVQDNGAVNSVAFFHFCCKFGMDFLETGQLLFVTNLLEQ